MELSIYIVLILIANMFSGRPALQTEKSVLELFPEFDSLKQDYEDLKQHYQDIQAKLAVLPSEIGTTYIRWSRNQCPNNSYTELVYSGYAGGGSWNERGSAAEPVCLPKDPDFVKTRQRDTLNGRIYGAEFRSELFASDSVFQDVPCAVCRVKQASSVIMIPGKNRCYTGWNMEYNGYLASNYYEHDAAGSYVCIDIQPEYLTGGSTLNDNGRPKRKTNGKLVYGVVAKCGVLQCPPYKKDYPLTCVVCSK